MQRLGLTAAAPKADGVSFALPGFVGAWQDYLADARQRGGLAMFRALQVTLRLIQHANEQRPNPSDMTEDEFSESQQIHLRAMISEQPELAVGAAVEVGWRLTPPGEDADDDDDADK